MGELVAGLVDWGIEVMERADLFGEKWQDGIVNFGRQHRGKWLSETNRHWLAWLYVTKEDEWPQELLDLVWFWGDRISQGKNESFDDLADQMRLESEAANGSGEWA